MTDCCILVACRPLAHKRLVASLFPLNSRVDERTLLPVNASKVTTYALARPSVLPLIARDLNDRTRTSLARGQIG